MFDPFEKMNNDHRDEQAADLQASPEVHPANRKQRRAFLKTVVGGIGCQIALPHLSSLPLRAEESGKQVRFARSEGQAPVRFGCVFFSNGVEPEHWWAEAEGSSKKLGAALSPLQQHCDQFTFIKGLFNEQAASHPSPHMGRMANLLSGAWISQDQAVIQAGHSMDQVLAKRLANATDLPSLVMGVEPTELRLEDGLSMIYGSCISWASNTKPATKEIYPARVYDLIMGNQGNRELDRSILDAAVGDAKSLRANLSHLDQTKLDEFFDAVRDIETRIDRSTKEESLAGWRPSIDQPTFAKPSEELPQDVSEHMKLMLDLMVLAFQMDKTRVATCMLNNDLSQMNFGFLDGVRGSLHLDLTHNGRDPELEAMYLRTNQFHIRQLAYLIERMGAIEEGDGTLLDHSMILFGSNLFDGDKHQADEMPLLLAGGGGGTIRQGQIIDVSDAALHERRACSLYLSLMDRMGVELPSFGDAKQRFAPLG